MNIRKITIARSTIVLRILILQNMVCLCTVFFCYLNDKIFSNLANFYLTTIRSGKSLSVFKSKKISCFLHFNQLCKIERFITPFKFTRIRNLSISIYRLCYNDSEVFLIFSRSDRKKARIFVLFSCYFAKRNGCFIYFLSTNKIVLPDARRFNSICF